MGHQGCVHSNRSGDHVRYVKKRRVNMDSQITEYIIIFIYAAASYWAAGKTVYANKLMIGKASDIFLQRLIVGCLLGIILIPIAIIKSIFSR